MSIIYHPKQVSPRKTQLAVAHDLARKIGLETRVGRDRTAYEAFLYKQIGKRSLKGATRAERNTVIKALEVELAELDMRTLHVPEYVSDDEALSVLN